LALTPTAQEGQLRLSWTAPTVFPGNTLDSYQIRAQTFSLTDVGGSTTTWWGASGGILIQGLYGESPGQAVVRTMGPAGSNYTASLFPGGTYYVAVRSADDVGTPNDLWSDVVQVISGSPLDTPPASPIGLSVSTATNALVLSWTDLSAAQKGLDFDRYLIYRSQQSGIGFVLIGSATASAYLDTSASVGIAYYYHVTALDLGAPAYPGKALESGASNEVVAIRPSATGAGNPPLRPNGLSMSVFGGQFTLHWHPVTLDTSGRPAAVDHYVVYRYDLIGSSPTLSTVVPLNALSYTDTVGGLTYYYAIMTVSASGVASDISDYADSQGNRYAIAPDDIDTRVVLPMSIETELNSEKNAFSEDLEIRLKRRQQDEVDLTLRSYHVGVYKAASGSEVLSFAFSQNDMQVQLGLGATLGAGRLSPAQVQTLQRSAGTSAGSIAQIVSAYWFNGGSYIRISDPELTSNEALSVHVRNIGIYQVRATQISTTFQLTQGSPYPRVITPNDPSQNNRVFWFFDNPSDNAVTGTIYDIRGAKVRDLAVNSQSPTANSLVWDGHDSRGAVVRSGVYLYKISAGKDTQTGTVVVAR